ADEILNTAVDNGINFIDTADVYGDRESEKAVGRLVKNRSERIYVATKCGRRLNPHTNEAYTPKALRGFVEDSLKNMQLECIDLVQIHCPPNEIFYRPDIFEEFEKLIAEGKILNMGVSVEKVEQAIKAMEFDIVSTVQIIFNMFRQRPDDLFLDLAKMNNVGVIVRVPLASGLLTGKFDKNTSFSREDHRNFNREGKAFDKGETFSGIDYETGLKALDEIKSDFPDSDLALLALKWILMFNEVSCVIPGASKQEQLLANIKASELPDLTQQEMNKVKSIYNKNIKPLVHQLW